MTDEAPGEDESLRFSQVLRRLGEDDGDRISVSDIVAAFGERAFGALMLCVGLLNLIPWPPGGTTITGAPLLFITAQLAMGRDTLWLPSRVCGASFSRASFRAGLKRVLPVLEKVERLTKPRLSWAVGPVAERLIGMVCFVLSCIIVLPIFGGNFAPAVAITVFAVGIVQRDGTVVLLGWAALLASIAVLAVAARVIWEMAQGIWAWVQARLG